MVSIFIVAWTDNLAFPFHGPKFGLECCPVSLVTVAATLDFRSTKFPVPSGCVGCAGRLVDVSNR